MEGSDAEERRRRVETTCVAENAFGEPRVVLSPSGRFRLTVRTYRLTERSWSYSRGIVERVDDGSVVADVARNLGQFHHTFLTKGGEEWLVAGRSYTSQTLVNLDRAEVREPPGDPYESNAFCWASCFLSRDERTLVVDGCIWACPYEYRFYDFTDPAARGWQPLPIEPDGYLEVESEKPPVWREDGVFECYAVSGGEVVARTALRRDGDRMLVAERFVDPAEQARRDETARAHAAEEAFRERFRAEDPIYLAMRSELARLALPDDGYSTWGKKDGARLAGKYFRRKEPHASADLQWGADGDGVPIAVQLYDGPGNRAET
ncbi:MAG: hypothetical protein ABI175_27540, partial [Polyangiales bacterium]